MDILYIIAGLLLLFFGGDALVSGAKDLALKLGVPAFAVSVTVVAFGTSAPELLVAIQAAFSGAPSLALGNIVGSNIANVFLVLGVPALIFTINSDKTDIRRDYVLMMMATGLFIVLAVTGSLRPMDGVIFLVVLLGILVFTLHRATKDAAMRARLAEDAEEDDVNENWKVGLFLVIGLFALPIGANLLVKGSVSIAQAYGISEAVIGLTIIAIGTSLPELATTVMAARRGAADVAIGNVIGSNLFNLLAIGGVAALFGPFAVEAQFIRLDFWVMLAASVVLVAYVYRHVSLTRLIGAIFCAIYVIYMVTLI